tara:strand:+ start:341 stop:862 length:522 start_codon:yes stop_codon:yes gene_type:complete
MSATCKKPRCLQYNKQDIEALRRGCPGWASVIREIKSYADRTLEARVYERVLKQLKHNAFCWQRFVGTTNAFFIKNMADVYANIPDEYSGVFNDSDYHYHMILLDLIGEFSLFNYGGQLVVADFNLCRVSFVNYLQDTNTFSRGVTKNHLELAAYSEEKENPEYDDDDDDFDY